MNSDPTPTILLVPGLRDHVPEHWQTLLEAKLPERAIGAADGARQALVRGVDRCARPVARGRSTGRSILVAHSAGVMITVHWAQRHERAIHGALLAAPPDFESPLPEGYPTQDVLQRERLAADAACAACLSEHRRRQYQRSAGTPRSRRRPCCGVGQPARRRGCGRSPQSRRRARRMAAGGRPHSRTARVRAAP